MENKSEVRDNIITGSFAIGADGMKEPLDWKDYANKLEDALINMDSRNIKLHSKIAMLKLELNRLSRPVTDAEIDDMFMYDFYEESHEATEFKRRGAKALRDYLNSTKTEKK